MNPHRKFKNHGPDGLELVFMALVMCFTVFVAIVVEPAHKKNIAKLSEPPLIVCGQCRGSGEYPADVNKLMMEASLALYINHHLMVDKCKKCARLESGSYVYCDKVNDRYTVLLKEYAAAGPKIDLAACSKCMGMGRFSCKKADGSYQTQEEYNKEYELELQSNKKNPQP